MCEDAPPRGRWLHAHLRTCAVQVWFQSGGVGAAPDCTCTVDEDLDRSPLQDGRGM